MKTNYLFIGLFILLTGLFYGCEQEKFIEDVKENQAAEERMGKGKGNGNNGGSNTSVELFKVVYTGNVSYANGNYSIDDPSGQGGVINNIDPVYVYIAKSTGKYTLMKSIPCNLPITSFLVSGLDTLDNACLDEEVCSSLFLRQYDLKHDRQKVFANLHIIGGQVPMRGFIQDQTPGQERIAPINIGESVVVTLDRIEVSLGPGSACNMAYHFFNADNGNGFNDGGPVLSDPIPDQSLIITKLDPDLIDPCDPVLSCE